MDASLCHLFTCTPDQSRREGKDPFLCRCDRRHQKSLRVTQNLRPKQEGVDQEKLQSVGGRDHRHKSFGVDLEKNDPTSSCASGTQRNLSKIMLPQLIFSWLDKHGTISM